MLDQNIRVFYERFAWFLLTFDTHFIKYSLQILIGLKTYTI
jgi:hypothetical protein